MDKITTIKNTIKVLSCSIGIALFYCSMPLHSQHNLQNTSEGLREKAKESFQAGLIDSSLYYYTVAIELAKIEADFKQLFILYNDISLSYYSKGLREYMLKYNDSAMTLSHKVDVTLDQKVGVVMNRAHVYSLLGDDEETISIYKNLLQSLDTASAFKMNSFVHMNLAKTYANIIHKDSTYFEKAIFHAEEAERYAGLEKDSLLIGRTMVYLGTLYAIHPIPGKKGKGITKLLAAQTLLKEKGDVQNHHFAVVQLATAYYANGDYHKAIQVVDNAMEDLEKKGRKNDFLHALRNKQLSHAGLQEWEPAYKTLQQFTRLNDSIESETVKSNIAELEAKFQNREKSLQLEAVQLEKQLAEKRNLYLSLSILSLILVLALLTLLAITLRYRLKTQRTLAKQKELIAKEEIKRRKAEEEKIKANLELKTRQLVSSAIYVSERNEMLNDIALDIENAKNGSVEEKLKTIRKKINNNTNPDVHWNEFRIIFEEVHPQFIQRLKMDFPQLTEKETRLLALIKLGLTIKEIANILHLEPNSIKTARYRLKGKLLNGAEGTLESFVINY